MPEVPEEFRGKPTTWAIIHPACPISLAELIMRRWRMGELVRREIFFTFCLKPEKIGLYSFPRAPVLEKAADGAVVSAGVLGAFFLRKGFLHVRIRLFSFHRYLRF